nr:phospholipase-like protein [Tanacetum cinerariifolium]
MAHLTQVARDANSNQLKDMLLVFFERENELDFALSRQMSQMVGQYTHRVAQRLELIGELEKLQGSILAYETVNLLRDLNDADLSKSKAFMTAMSQIQINVLKKISFVVQMRGKLHLGRREFSLITGCRFGEATSWSSSDLIGVIEDEEFFLKLCDEDIIRVCLLLPLEVIFMRRKLVHEFDDTLMRLVENLEAWNFFPWDAGKVNGFGVSSRGLKLWS